MPSPLAIMYTYIQLLRVPYTKSILNSKRVNNIQGLFQDFAQGGANADVPKLKGDQA